ncbi:phage baseplate assembly protein V [Paenibacillus montanisoli]|uniref:Baseplate assembly protein n=1 Tax=Paenibacillus montanisoli TaxID=2081970 RepID=A0A328UED2_9BACL|nr:phage baseplate assembly protein V [Paenibacillus montanisoli]RAP78306.1 baseplate assembly protein [Paenibacillus montanisoli]
MSKDVTPRFYGKYRGTVINNVDPEQRGRLMVQVTGVTNVMPSTWAMPCLPLAGTQMGIHVVPPIGSGVWVEYEQGDIDYPIWSGCWWGTVAEVPPMALAGIPNMPNILLQTSGQNFMVISDVPGGPGITLKVNSGAMVIINDEGIVLSNGKGATISMIGPSVSINGTALTIT